MDYGVQPTGYVRKPLSVFLAEIEAANIAEFGAGIIQTEQSVLGQLNGIFASAAAELDENIEATYQSFDADQAELLRMDIIANLRGLTRESGESDNDFRLRITNQGQTDIKMVANVDRLNAVTGVTWASARENASSVPLVIEETTMPPHSVAYAAIGGTDEAVGLQVYQMSVPGIELFGNTEVEVVADGYCQIARFIRPVDVPIRVEVDVRHIPDNRYCAPPSESTVGAFIVAAFSGLNGFRNGDIVSRDRIEVETGLYGDLKIMDVRLARADNLEGEFDDSVAFHLFERPVILAPYVTVRYV